MLKGIVARPVFGSPFTCCYVVAKRSVAGEFFPAIRAGSSPRLDVFFHSFLVFRQF